MSGCDVGVQHQSWGKKLWAQVSLVTVVRYFFAFSFPFLLVGILGQIPAFIYFGFGPATLLGTELGLRGSQNLCYSGTHPDLTLELSMGYKLENNCSAFSFYLYEKTYNLRTIFNN